MNKLLLLTRYTCRKIVITHQWVGKYLIQGLGCNNKKKLAEKGYKKMNSIYIKVGYSALNS